MKSAVLVVATLAATACSKKPAAAPVAPPPPEVPLMLRPEPAISPENAALERTAFDRAKPVFDKYCLHCHTKRGRFVNAARLEAFDMTSYPLGGRYKRIIGNTIRDVLGQSGVPASMPHDRKGAVKGNDLALVLTWSDAWARSRGESRDPK